jgi:hypothetical protein
MAKRLADDAAVAATDDEDSGSLSTTSEERDVDRHLVIDELVGLGKLHRPVQGQDAAEISVIEDLDLLERRGLGVDPPDVEGMGDPHAVRQLVPSHRRAGIRSGGKAAHGSSLQKVGRAKAER